MQEWHRRGVIVALAAGVLAVALGAVALATRGDGAARPATTTLSPVLTTPVTATTATSAATVPTVASTTTTTPTTRAPTTTASTTTTVATTPATTVPTPEQLVGSVPKVFLTCEEGDGWASAVVLDESGLLVTNDHVAEPEDCTLTRLQVGFARSSGDAPTPALDAVVVAVDADHDLAVLQVVDRSRRPVGGRRPIALGDSDALQIGQRMTVLGFPGSGGDTITFTDGAVSGFEPNGSVTRGWIKTSAVMSPGSSGGGWFDAGGRLVGLTSWGSDGGINRGVPVNLVKPLLATARRVVAAGGLTTAPPTTRPTPSTTLPPVPPGTIRVSGAFVSSGKQGGLPVDRVDALPAGATVACAFWVTQGIAAGTVVDVVWTVDGVELPSATERGFRWRAVDGDRVNWCAPKNGVAAGPLPTGQHVLALVVGGRRVEVARVRVG